MLLESFCQSNLGNKLNVQLDEDHRNVKDICIIIMENGRCNYMSPDM